VVSGTQQKYENVSGSAVNQQLLTSLLLLVFMPASVQTIVHIQLSQTIHSPTPSVVGSKFLPEIAFGIQSFAIAISLSPFQRSGHL
jgi:hypothetical protein